MARESGTSGMACGCFGCLDFMVEAYMVAVADARAKGNNMKQ